MSHRNSVRSVLSSRLRPAPGATWALLLLTAFQVAFPLQLAAVNVAAVWQESEEDNEPSETESEPDVPELFAPSGRVRRGETHFARSLVRDVNCRPQLARASAPAIAEQKRRNGIGGPLRC